MGYTAGGNPKRVVRYARTQREVAQALSETAAQYGKGLLLSPDRITVAEYLDRWLEHKANSVKPVTLAGYQGDVERHISPPWAGCHCNGFRPYRFSSYYLQMQKRGAKGNTVRLVHVILHEALKQAVRWDLLALNPCERVDPPRVERYEPRVWTPEEVWRFLAATQQHRWYTIFLLALTSGMRRGELLGLKWEDIDWAGGYLQVRHILTVAGSKVIISTPKSYRSRRPVYLSDDTLASLKEHRERQQTERAAARVWIEDGSGSSPPRWGHRSIQET